ncbi:MAG: preprotein translocase subunit YajC [Alphaproteobacteria bacterium]|jgi:preprotein translocase subunit YajC|nr:preprotein translocase subunit YajC [Alphaproteobacteria bacterium]MDP7222892.1 preprotein translocase subunit YajC [Alphaproteobacteria bacterium]
MFISAAYAAAGTAAAEAPSAWEAFALNMLLIVIMVLLFYVLLIKPQQKRLRKHKEMVDAMKKGDKVLTAGGLIGHVHKITKDSDEVVLDMGGNVKLTVLRSTIQNIRN